MSDDQDEPTAPDASILTHLYYAMVEIDGPYAIAVDYQGSQVRAVDHLVMKEQLSPELFRKYLSASHDLSKLKGDYDQKPGKFPKRIKCGNVLAMETGVAHVSPSSPENNWRFALGQTMIVGARPYTALRLDEIKDGSARFTVTYEHRRVSDWLHLDAPCVALRLEDGTTPALVVTLRGIEGDIAVVQVSGHRTMPTICRMVEQ